MEAELTGLKVKVLLVPPHNKLGCHLLGFQGKRGKSLSRVMGFPEPFRLLASAGVFLQRSPPTLTLPAGRQGLHCLLILLVRGGL